jgi:hypothetical protein
VVLVDAVSLHNRRWWNEFKGDTLYFDKTRYVRWGRTFARLGLMRLFKPLPYDHVPENIRDLVTEHYCQLPAYDATLDEIVHIDTSIAQINALPLFPAVPLAVMFPDPVINVRNWVSYRVPEPLAVKMEKLHEELVREQLAYSPQSAWVLAGGATHAVHLDRPDLVVQTIVQMVAQLRAAPAQ